MTSTSKTPRYPAFAGRASRPAAIRTHQWPPDSSDEAKRFYRVFVSAQTPALREELHDPVADTFDGTGRSRTPPSSGFREETNTDRSAGRV